MKKVVEEKQGCVYYVVNKKNSKGYVGKHCSPDAERRWNGHWNQARRGCKHYFHCALRKYKLESFTWEVVWRGAVSKLDDKEIYYIRKLHTRVDDPKGGGYNLTYGGEGGVPSEPMRKKRNKAIKSAWKNPLIREKHSELLKSILDTPECRAQRSAQRRAEWADPVYRSKMLKIRGAQKKGMLGKEFSQAERANLSAKVTTWWRALSDEEFKSAVEKRADGLRESWRTKSAEDREQYRANCRAVWAKRKLREI